MLLFFLLLVSMAMYTVCDTMERLKNQLKDHQAVCLVRSINFMMTKVVTKLALMFRNGVCVLPNPYICAFSSA